MDAVKNPDLKAPRFRHEFVNLMTNKLLEKIESKNSKVADLTYLEVRNVIKTFNGMMWEHIMKSRDGVELPESLGNVYVATCPPPKRKNIDMKKSIELGVKVLHRNWETDGHIGKVIYSVYGNKYRFKHNEMWSFNTGREFKRAVSAFYPENWRLYKKLDNTLQEKKDRENKLKAEAVINRSEYIPDNYNEFDL